MQRKCLENMYLSVLCAQNKVETANKKSKLAKSVNKLAASSIIQLL